ncbi:hypothetical protein GCM10023204_41160 [Actinomycetospora succinea]
MGEQALEAKVYGVPRVQAVPDWVAPPLTRFASMEHALLWTFVHHGRSPELHGAQSALAWVGGVNTTTPATADAAFPTRWRSMGELIVCGAVSAGDPYPAVTWWRDAGIGQLDTADRRRWWEQWSSYGWTRAIADGAGRALSWALGFSEETPPVLPRHLDDGSRATTAAREECARLIREALARPLVPRGLVVPSPVDQTSAST